MRPRLELRAGAPSAHWLPQRKVGGAQLIVGRADAVLGPGAGGGRAAARRRHIVEAWARLQRVFAQDDPTDELSAAWAIKEQVRRLLESSSLEQARAERMRLRYYADVARCPRPTASASE